MTVISDVKTALAGLKSAQASFETFALSTDNEQAKQLYQDAAKQTQSIVDSIAPRVQQIRTRRTSIQTIIIIRYKRLVRY